MTALAKPEGTDTALAVEQARAFLATAKSTVEVKALRDQAQAVAAWLRAQRASVDSQNDAAEVRMRAERRLGQLMSELEKATGGGDGSNQHRAIGHKSVPVATAPVSPSDAPAEVVKLRNTVPTLAERGISKQDSHRWQRIASVPEEKFEAHLKATRAKAERITQAGVLKLAALDARTELAADLEAKPLPAPEGPYDVIALDPPWAYDARAEDVTHRAANPYPPMTIEQLCQLPVAQLAEPNATIWLWTTNAFMREAYACLDAWGFAAKTILTWDKVIMGTGDWLRGRTEHCILAVRGRPLVRLTNQTTLISEQRREHSRKPEAFYALVEQLCPGTRLEMFSRTPRPGWVAWGAEPGRFQTST